MKRSIEQVETIEQQDNVKRAKIEKKNIDPVFERVQEMKSQLISTFNIEEKKVKILGLGDCVFVEDVFKDQAYTEMLMQGLDKEFSWLQPSDPRAARNRAGQELGRVKACLRKYKISKTGQVLKPRYGNYTVSQTTKIVKQH